MNRQKAIIIGLSIVALAMLVQYGVMNALVLFLLAGVIPGTSYSVPFWVMMALYCTIISLLAAWYVERLIVSARTSKAMRTRQSRMPRRRYSHI